MLALKINNEFKKNDTNQLILGDALEVLKQIPDGYIDHCITDPPYNISGYDHKKDIGWLNSNKYWNGTKKFKKIAEEWDKFGNVEYLNFTKKWLEGVVRVIKPNGNIIIFGSYHNIYDIGAMLKQLDRKIINSIVWYKRNAFPNITQRMLCESTEHIIWAANNDPKHVKNWTFNYDQLKKLNSSKICTSCKTISNADSKYCRNCGSDSLRTKYQQMRNLWDIPSTPKKERKFGKHPSQKPLEVLSRLVIGCSEPGDAILDPFIGSGTTAVSARMHNRKFIGVDNNKTYLKLAVQRLKRTN